MTYPQLLLLGCACFITALLPAQDRGMKPVQVIMNGSLTTLYQESHALLIGNSDYMNFDKLPGVVEDIKALRTLLESQGFGVNVAWNLTRDQLDRAFSDFISRYGQGKENRLLFYFGGHGYTVRTAYGDSLGYIVTVDAPFPDDDNPGPFQEKCMEMAQIEIYAKRIQSKHALFIFDACFSGSLFENTRALPEYINYNTSRPVRQFITSGTANEKVPDHSIFRQQLVKALSGEADSDLDGYITGTELGSFLQKTVTNYSKEFQHPQYGKIRNPNLDKGDFVFVLNSYASGGGSGPAVPSVETVRPLVHYGKIEITTQIDGSLYVDGTFVQQITANTVFLLKDLVPGDHFIKITGQENFEKTVTVYANQTTFLVVDRKTARAGSISPEMVFVRGGSFEMGSENGDPDEKPLHTVTLEDFYIGKYEVTLYQFRQFIFETGYQTDADKDRGSYHWTGVKWEKKSGVNWKVGPELFIRQQTDYDHPVLHVSWNDASEYCKWLSGKTGQSYRLPREAEWEYAAGNGAAHTRYSWGDKEPSGESVGNVADQAAKRRSPELSIAGSYDDGYVYTAPIGSFKPNTLGICDMTGNVAEWCLDWYDPGYYAMSPENDPEGPNKGTYRVIRGGSWDMPVYQQRVADRSFDVPSYRNYAIGFRVVRTR